MQISLLKIIPFNQVWFNLILAFFIFNVANAQSDEKQAEIERAETAIRDLAEGVLVVRLESNRKKIQKLEEVIAQEKINARSLKNLHRQLEQTKLETKERNTLLMQNFENIYNFSNIVFIYDYDSERLRAGEQNGYFIGKDLQVDPDLSLGKNKFLTLRFGTTDLATTSGIEGMIITDQLLQDLTIPFPFAYKEGGFMYIFDKLFDGKNAATRNFPRMIEKLNKKLKKYHNEVE